MYFLRSISSLAIETNALEAVKTSIKLLIDDGSKKGKIRIYAEKRGTKPSLAAMAGPLMFLCLCLRLIGLPFIISVPIAFGLYYCYKRGVETEVRELAEYKKKHTVNGFKARQVYGEDPRDYRFIVIILAFPYSYYLYNILHLAGTEFDIAFCAPLAVLLALNIYAKRWRAKYS